MTKTEKEFESLLEPTVNELGYDLYDIEYVKERDGWYLKLYIDKPDGIDLDDCEKVSNKVSEVLDEKDPIATQYMLEVSSCGLERNLREPKHFESAKNQNIEIKLYKPLDGEKVITGELVDFDENSITIKNEKEIVLNKADIASAKILFNWEE